MRKLYLSAAIALTAIAAPAVAEAATAYATANVNMRSGPSTQYPPILVVPYSSPVEIYGCLSAANWCDVAYGSYRGWISGSYLQTTYSQQRIYVGPQYYEPLGIPIVTFSIDSYWDRHYRSRDFYRDRDRWREPARWDRDRQYYVDRDREPSRIDRDDRRRPPRVDDRDYRPDPQPRPPRVNREDDRPAGRPRPPIRMDNDDNRRPPARVERERRNDNRNVERPPQRERRSEGDQDRRRICPPGEPRCVRESR
ncbi:SH3 domain-containing protein [Agrobacterium sp. a22-2]|uniref:SH3 domain-containing protein n=1 Tax=Agrobacterium sp. a22-2 TaxID=2283840 RepID=UPI001447CC1F|nr:SH3 domain-containing protein [Agrobacterium sp. a22-2]NKN37098.1 SH3 domain-containing protein [Agrobacterium sp. a22-2]